MKWSTYVEDSLSAQISADYNEWRSDFAARRLRFTSVFGMVILLAINLAELLSRPDELELTGARILSIFGFMPVFAAMYWTAHRAPQYWITGLIIVGSIAAFGVQFSYYTNGQSPIGVRLPVREISFIFFVMVVLIPVYWRAHVIAQIISLILMWEELWRRNLPIIQQDSSGWIWLFLTVVVSSAAIYFYERLSRKQRATVTRLVRAEADYRNIFEESVEGIFRSTFDGSFLAANPAMAKMLGFESERALIDRNPDIASFYRSPKQRTQFINQLQRDGSVNGALLDLLTMQREPLRVMVNARIANSTEHGDYIEGFIHDLTAHSRIQSALRVSQQRLDVVMNTIPHYAYWTDREGSFVGCNQRFADLPGLASPEGIQGLSHDAMPWADSADFLRKLEREAINSAQQQADVRWHVADFLPHEAWFDVSCLPIYDVEQSITGALVLLADRTEQQREREAARRSERILEVVGFASDLFLREPDWRKLLDAVVARFGETTGVSRIVLYQQSARNNRRVMSFLHEWSADGILSHTTMIRQMHIPIDADGMNRWHSEFSNRRVIVGHVNSLPEDERAQLHHLGVKSTLVVPIFVSDELWGFMGLDACEAPREWTNAEIDAVKAAVTTLGAAIERDMAQQELLQKQRLDSIGVLAGGIAHDFNNLLTGVLAQSSLALRQVGDHKASKNISKALASAKKAADLTRQLLAYAGKGQFQVADIDLHQLVRENLSLFETALPVTVELDMNLHASHSLVRADVGQMQQLIMNLVINAGDAMRDQPAGELMIQSSNARIQSAYSDVTLIGNKVLEPGNYLRLSIADNGTGMDNETLLRIFDPYFTTKSYGQGLGLSATLGIIRAHGGGMKVESQVGAGSQFTIWLPIVEVASAEADQTEIDTGNDMVSRVLVVDDEAVVREAVCDILDLHEVQVMQAGSGEEGVSLYQRHWQEIDVVLLDMKMPGMDGRDTYYELQKYNPTIRVIVSSGYSELDVSRQFNQGEISAFLQKPYDFDTLVTTVQNLLDS